jgi:CheY-like chemotaxis protein
MIDPVEIILYAEDDESDAFLVQHAFKKVGIDQQLLILPNGRRVIDYLAGTEQYADRQEHPLPCLLLLDMNMPGVSGLDVLKWVRSSRAVSTIPVVMLTSSNQQQDIHRAYQQGANGYLVKPGSLEAIVAMARSIKDYWLVHNRCSNA